MQRNAKSRNRGQRKNRSGGLRGSGGYLRSSSLSSSSPLGGNSSYRGGFPDRSRVKLCYVTSDSNSSTVAPVNYVWSGNGAWDPDVTSAGSQPVNWDDWALQYSRYRVWGSKIIVRATSTVTLADCVLSARHASTALGTTTFLSQQCQPYTYAFNVGAGNGMTGPSGLGSNRIEMKMSTPQFLGLSHTAFQGEDGLTALTTAQPAHQWYWNLSSWHQDRTTACVLYFTVVVEYDIEFYDRVESIIDLETRFQQLKDSKHRKGLVSKSDRKSIESEELSLDSPPEFEMVQNIRMPLNGPPTLVRQSAYSTASRVSSTRN